MVQALTLCFANICNITKIDMILIIKALALDSLMVASCYAEGMLLALSYFFGNMCAVEEFNTSPLGMLPKE